MKTIFFECNMGAAGDMLMSALYEICEEKEWFLHTMRKVFLPYGVTISAESSVKCGVRGTHMNISVHGIEEFSSDAPLPSGKHTQPLKNETPAHDSQETGKQFHTDCTSLLTKIQSLALPDTVKEEVAAIYHLIGDAESKVHGIPIDQIHFHEIGTLDALADIVGCALLIHSIAPEQILCTPIHVGNGFVRCAHGVLPVPAPATAELLKGIPYYTGSITSELCTPTGAAILKHYVSRFFSMPTLTTSAIGYGMGQKDFEFANCVRVFLGETAPQKKEDLDDVLPADDSVLSVSCNIDDMTGEALGLATEIMMAAGALDVYTIPVQMKKNRPGILLTCICEPEEREKFTGLFFLHTSTRGVRYQLFERAKLESTFETRTSAYGDIRIKRSRGYGIEKEKPEFEDLKSVVLKNHCSFSLDDVTKSIFH